MKAVILAGGKGTRLAPYTTVFPKPLLPVGEKPILEIIINQVAHYGFRDIVLSVGYLAELIQAYFQNSKINLKNTNLTYVKEEKPLGTAGPLALVPGLDETFLVMNGDVLTTLDYGRFLAFHREEKSFLTVAMHKKQVRMELGILKLDGDNRIKSYLEKPTYTHFNSMGIYLFEPGVLRYIQPNVYLDIPTLIMRLIADGKRVFGYYHDKPHFWLDIGQPDDYQKAVNEFLKRKEEFFPDVDDDTRVESSNRNAGYRSRRSQGSL